MSKYNIKNIYKRGNIDAQFDEMNRKKDYNYETDSLNQKEIVSNTSGNTNLFNEDSIENDKDEIFADTDRKNSVNDLVQLEKFFDLSGKKKQDKKKNKMDEWLSKPEKNKEKISKQLVKEIKSKFKLKTDLKPKKTQTKKSVSKEKEKKKKNTNT